MESEEPGQTSGTLIDGYHLLQKIGEEIDGRLGWPLGYRPETGSRSSTAMSSKLTSCRGNPGDFASIRVNYDFCLNAMLERGYELGVTGQRSSSQLLCKLKNGEPSSPPESNPARGA